MIVNSKKLGVIVIGGKLNPDGTVGPLYKILPGANQLPKEAKEFLKHPDIESMIEDGELIVFGDDNEDEEISITDIPQAKAIKLVKETFAIKTLRDWETKASGKLLKAIQKQIDEMMDPGEEKEEDGE